MDNRLPHGPYFRLNLRGADEKHPDLMTVATFLLDFTTLYELIRMEAEPEYGRYPLTRFVLYRNAPRVRYEHKLFLERLRHESPLEVVTLFAAAGAGGVGALWGLVQTIEKVWFMRLNRRKLLAEVEKLERENEAARGAPHIVEPIGVLERIQEHDEGQVVATVLNRLASSEVRITQADIDLVMDLTEIKRR
jgi:hypothetical protein